MPSLFPPMRKTLKIIPFLPLALASTLPPAIASKNRFEIRHNTTKFATPLTGFHTVVVTTRDWFAEVEKVIFEGALLKSKMEYLYK